MSSRGKGWRTLAPARRLAPALAVALAGMMALAVAPATALSLTAHTNRGGKCHLQTHASRTGTQISYGIRVNQCSTHFGVRYAVSQGTLYDRTDDVPVTTGYMKQRKGNVPYANSRNVAGTDASHAYRTRIDVSIVLKTRRDPSTPHPEQWLDPGAHCHVTTTDRAGDTLGCTLGDSLPAS